MDTEVSVITPSIPGREWVLDRNKSTVKYQTYKNVTHLYDVDVDRRGPAWMRNRLVERSDTEWISFLDDDDTMHINHLELHMPFTEEYDVIFSWGQIVHKGGGAAVFDSSYNPHKILRGHNTIPVTATVNRSFFDRVGGFSETERFEDWFLWKSLILKGARFKCIEQVTWDYNMGLPDQRNSKE